ncbi:MAG: hypothetical protein R3Y11_05185 [Pseudomonadota bacterium]
MADNKPSKDDLDYEDLLEVTYDALVEGGFRDICIADAEDIPEPKPIDGHIPDMQAVNSKGIPFVFEICMPETYAELELIERFQAFTKHVAEVKGQFVAIVPDGDEGLVAAFIEEHKFPDERLTIWEA